MEIKNLEKKSGDINANINNRMQEIQVRIADAEDTIDTIDSTVKECKLQKPCNSKLAGNPGHN